MSDGDKVVLMTSLGEQDSSVPFQTKQYLEITDNNSTNGVFNGSITFDLQNLSSLYQYSDLANAYVEFPVRFGIKNTGSTTQTPTTGGLNSMLVKGGWHSFVNSVNINIGSTNVQSANIYQNLNTSFKMLTSWSTNELSKKGASLGLAVDDYLYDADDSTANSNVGVWNATTGTIYKTNAGFIGLSSKTNNNAIEERTYTTARDASSGFGNAILPQKAQALGLNTAQAATSAVSAGNWQNVTYAIATVYLGDISDIIKKMPLTKGVKGSITINYNAGKTTLVSDSSGAYTTSTSFNPIYGNSMPAMTTLRPATDAVNTWEITAEVSGAAFSGTNLTTAQPVITNARLYVPLFVGQPSIERELNQKKQITYLERFQTTIEVDKNGSYSGSISSGITNPRRITMYPFYTTTTNAAAPFDEITLPSDPMMSPLTHEGFGTSPLATIRGLQFTVSGKPIFQSPVDYDFHMFNEEIATLGLNGGTDHEQSTGLINARQWGDLYRFYTCDLSRRIEGSNGQSVPVQVSFTNATALKMRVVVEIEYEKSVVVDTQFGLVQNA